MDNLHTPLNRAGSPHSASSSHHAHSPEYSSVSTNYRAVTGPEIDSFSPSHLKAQNQTLVNPSSFAFAHNGPGGATVAQLGVSPPVPISQDPSRPIFSGINGHQALQNGLQNGLPLGHNFEHSLGLGLSSSSRYASPNPTPQHVGSPMHSATQNTHPGTPGSQPHFSPHGSQFNAHFNLQQTPPGLSRATGSAVASPRPQGQIRQNYYFGQHTDEMPVRQVTAVPNHSNLAPQSLSSNASTRFQNLQQDRREVLFPHKEAHSHQGNICRHFPPLAPAAHLATSTRVPESEKQTRRKDVPDSQHGTERHLLTLAGEISDTSLAESAQKIKRMDADVAELKNDPIFGTLCNRKDIKQDKHHQVFALAWLDRSCEPSPATVIPRNRIYARYVQMCGEYTLSPLMPAAFGRLVRMLFPNLTTRRLGMRGKSKYHYCGVKLRGDHSQVGSPLSSYSSGIMDSPRSANFHTPAQMDSPSVNHVFSTPVSFVNVQDHFLVNDYKYVPELYGMIEQSMISESGNNNLSLPALYSYLPEDFEYDPDIADTLCALVKIQCTSMFESVRFMKKDELLRILVPSQAVLTGPTFKLLNSEPAIEWAKDCDLIMYRSMLKMLSRLHAKSANKEIVGILREISIAFVSKLSAALGDRFCQKYKTMKLNLARKFIKLVDRLVRCIETGFRAAIVLSNPNDRNMMLSDWVKLELQDTVLREIPCGTETAQSIINILEVKVVQLLQDTPPEGFTLAHYASFLFELPGLFPNVNPWLFCLLLSNLLTSFIREMSMVGSRSFKLWWIVGCWVNEYMSWSFELGGYLFEEFRLSHEAAHAAFEFDVGLSANVSGNTELNAQEKSISTLDLLGGIQEY